MTYWTWSGHNGDEPTLHVFGYGLMNLWDDGLTVEEHWTDADPPTLRPEVLADLAEWGGIWNERDLQIEFHNGNEHGAMMWKLKYASKTGCTSPDSFADSVRGNTVILRGTGIK